MTTLANYQARAAATAQDAAYDHDYLIPMIVGETGELFGQKAKSVWHGWTPEKLQEELVSEFGDICWGTAILLKMEGIQTATRQTPTVVQARFWPTEDVDPWHILLQRSQGLHLFHVLESARSYIPGEAKRLWLALEDTCYDITGVKFDKVLEYNVQKLASRAARGVLQGAGDHR